MSTEIKNRFDPTNNDSQENSPLEEDLNPTNKVPISVNRVDAEIIVKDF